MKKFQGTGVALVSPFKEDGGIDFEALERLINYQIANNVDYLVVLGSTGEPSALSPEEEALLVKKIIAINNGRLPLVLGVGGNNTLKVKQNLEQMDLSAFDAILSVAPYYNKPSQEGLYQHFKVISEACEKPVIIYNVPSRTGVNIDPETVVRLALDFKNIIGIKEAAGDMEQVLRIIQHMPKDFLVISGDDAIALPMTLCGGAGVISVIGQAFPKDFSTMIRLALEGKAKEASVLHFKIMEGIDLAFAEGNPTGIKAILQALDICAIHVRLPLMDASAELLKKSAKFIESYEL